MPIKHAKCLGKTRVLLQTVQTKMHESNLCKPKRTSKVRAARTLLMQTMMHRQQTNVLCVYVHLTCNFTSLIFCIYAGYVASIFRNVSSCVVASRVCSQV